MCDVLTKKGWEVSVLAPPPCYPHGEHERRAWALYDKNVNHGVSVHRLWSWQPQEHDPGLVSRLSYYLFFSILASVWVAIFRSRYDLVLTTTPPITTGGPGLVFKIMTDKKWIVDVRDVWTDNAVNLDIISESSILTKMSRRYQDHVLTVADAITYVTDGLGDQLYEKYDISKSDMTIVRNGANTTIFSPCFEYDQKTIIYLGNVGYAYDIKACVSMMKHLKDDSIRLNIVGGGDMIPEVRVLVNDLGLKDKVEFTGTVSQEVAARMLQESSIGLAPLKQKESLKTTVPRKVYDYLACGLPVVGSKSEELEQFLNDAGAGVTVENNPRLMAQKIEELIHDEKTLKRYGKSGRDFIERYHSHDTHMNRLHERIIAEYEDPAPYEESP